MNARCECGCGEELPPSTGRPRRWVNDNHRKRGRPTPPSTVPTDVDGPLVRAVRRAVESADQAFDPVQEAQAEQALLLAAIVEGRGPSSVPASRELRALLEALASRLDQDHDAFIKLGSTPTRSGAPGGVEW
jgi:hypothetical protein